METAGQSEAEPGDDGGIAPRDSVSLRAELGLVSAVFYESAASPFHRSRFGPNTLFEGDVKSICYSTTAKLRESPYGRQSFKYGKQSK